MGTLASFFLRLADVLPKRILASLGIGVVSFSGVSLLTNTLISSFSERWDSIPLDVLKILSLAGFPDAFGILLGAVVARLTFSTISRLGIVS